MNARRKFFDDVSKLANSTAGVLQGAAGEVENLIKQRAEALIDRMDLVTREEFDAVKAMAETARQENETLAKRLAALEAKAKPARAKATKAKSSTAKTSRTATARKKTSATKSTRAKPTGNTKSTTRKTAGKAATKKKPTATKSR